MISLSLSSKHRFLEVLRDPRGHLPGVLWTTTSLSSKHRVLETFRDFRGHLDIIYKKIFNSFLSVKYQLWWSNQTSCIF